MKQVKISASLNVIVKPGQQAKTDAPQDTILRLC